MSIGAKTLSGLGYRGHVFWDTETFILPFFIYTQPEVAAISCFTAITPCPAPGARPPPVATGALSMPGKAPPPATK